MSDNVAEFKSYDDYEDEAGSSSSAAASKAEPKDVGGVGGARLLSIIERVERLEEEIAALSEDKKEVYAEAKGIGFDVKTIRKIIKIKKMDADKRREEEELLDLYKAAIGMM